MSGIAPPSSVRLAVGVFGAPWRHGFMVFLNTYFDASWGGEKNRAVVAGYSGQAEHFLAVEERWRNFLAVDGLEHFHVVDIKHRYVKWQPEVQKYADLLAASPLYGVIALVDEVAWKHRSAHEVYKNEELFPRPQHVALDMALTVMSNCLAEDQPTDQVAIYTDNDYGNRASAPAICEAWEKRTGVQFGGFTVLPNGASRDLAPIQFADLLANAYRHEDLHWHQINEHTAELMEAFQRSPFRNAVKRARQMRLRWEDD